jgi:hypothetical protein
LEIENEARDKRAGDQRKLLFLWLVLRLSTSGYYLLSFNGKKQQQK